MTTTTLRPNATVSSSGALTGAATVHAALSDDSDSSYVTLDNNESLRVDFEDFTLPALALTEEVKLRARVSRLVSPIACSGEMFIGVASPDGYTIVSWQSPTTITLVRSAQSYSEGEIDAMEVAINASFSAGQLRVYELYVDVEHTGPPTVTVTDPSGTITTDTTPAIEWTSDAEFQTHFRAVYMANGDDPDVDVPVADSGEVSSAAEIWTPDEQLANGVYDIYVKVAVTVDGEPFWSDWGTGTVTINVDRPADPTVTLTAESSVARFKIDVSNPGGGDVTSTHFQIQRSDDGGFTFADIRTVDGDGLIDPVGGDATAWDREAPNGITVTYRARAVHDFASGTSYSDWVEESGSWSSTATWIKHPTEPDLDLTLTPRSQPTKQRIADQGSFKVRGASKSIVVSDVRAAWEGEWVFMCESDDERNILEALAASGDPLLIQAPIDTYDWDDTWIVVRDYSRTRILDQSWFAQTDETLPWMEVARPDDNLAAWPAAL